MFRFLLRLRPLGTRSLAAMGSGLVVSIALGLACALPAFGHPTDRELQEAFQDRKRCELRADATLRIDHAKLGMTETELRSAVSELIPNQDAQGAASASGLEKGLARWQRPATGEVQFFEYELFNERVYRIRWRLGSRFERPILDELVRHGQTCFGRPEFDQTFEAEPGSASATLRRIEWIHEDRRIELRQLHPLRGGPVYLSVTSAPRLREMGVAGVGPFPEPTQSRPWWQRSMAPISPATATERETLGQAFLGLLSQLDH